MDFDDTPEEAAFRAEARAFLQANAPVRSEGLSPSGMTDAHSESEREHVRRAKEWQALLFDQGWAGVTWPKEYGGRGGTTVQQVIFNQEQSCFDVPPGVFAQGIGMAGPTLMIHGSAAQKERFLGPMLRGDEIWCQLFSEPGAGSDLAALATRAVRDGDEWVVNGQKVWTSSAHYSDWGILLARTDPAVPKHRGITYFLLDMRSPGIDVRPLRQITGSAHFNEVFLTGVRIPDANVVGPTHGGWGVAMTTLGNERSLIGAAGADVWPDLLRLARAAGAVDDPRRRQDMARTYTRLQIIRYLGWRSLTSLSQGRAPGPESSVAKLAYSAHLGAMGDLVLALQGPAGMLLDAAVGDSAHFGLQFLGQWSSRLGGGTDQIQRNIIAERVLGLPREPRVDAEVAFRDLVG